MEKAYLQFLRDKMTLAKRSGFTVADGARYCAAAEAGAVAPTLFEMLEETA